MTISVPPNTVIPAFPGAGSTPGAAAPQALDAGERWYVVQTQPNREAVALVNLHRQGFRTFMPQIVKTVRHARRTRTQQVPLFPGYFFTALDPDCAPWRRINGSLGVVSLIMGGDRPLPVPEGIVESLTVLTDNRGVADFGRKLEIGSDVRILAGPFADHLGQITHLDGQGRARVLIEIMGAARSIAISGRALISAGKPPGGTAVSMGPGADGKAVNGRHNDRKGARRDWRASADPRSTTASS